MNILKRNTANLITLLNLLSGCVAIILSFKGNTQLGALSASQWAFVAIGVAAVADFFDGFTARLLHTYSNLGKELDSLSDLVSFGVAPAMLLFNMLQFSPVAPEWLPWCALLIPVCGALRLARFNVDTRQSTSFIGLPIPANAIFWIGYVAMAASAPMLCSVWWVIPVVALESWLMISPMRMFSLKFHNYKISDNKRRYFLIAGAVILIFCMGLPSFVWIIVLYLLLSIKY